LNKNSVEGTKMHNYWTSVHHIPKEHCHIIISLLNEHDPI
jgi:hypothetical protein